MKKEPDFTIEDLLKYVVFEMNQIENPRANNYIFDFKIEGKINKEIAPGSIKADLELNEIEEKAACNFVVEEDKYTSNLNCKMDISKYKEMTLFTFKTSEINTDDNDIFLAKLDEVSLINEKDEEEKKNYTAIIIVSVIAGVLVIGGTTALIIYFIKCKKKTNTNLNNTEQKNMQEENKSLNLKIIRNLMKL